MRALILADREHWSYMQIAQALVKHNTDPDLHLDVMALKGHEREFFDRQATYDRCLIMGHQMVEGLLGWPLRVPRHWLTGIHSAHAFDPELRTTPDHDVSPPASVTRMLRKFRAVNCVSQRLFDLFNNDGFSLYLTPNGVDCNTFKPMEPLSIDGPLRVGVAYTPKHDKRKGVSEFIRPACEMVGAILVEAKARSDQHVSPEDMPAWHNSYNVYVCASSSEGFSIAVLEAAACGRCVVSTRVGGSTELIDDEYNGILVDRTVDSIAEGLARLKASRETIQVFGERMRQNVVDHWSWEKRAPAWLAFLTA